MKMIVVWIIVKRTVTHNEGVKRTAEDKNMGTIEQCQEEYEQENKEEEKKAVPFNGSVMQPAIDRLKERVVELKKEIDKLKSQGNMNHWAETAENTIQCLYVAIQVLELTEAA